MKRRKIAPPTSTLVLTSLMDMMTILLIFLLTNYSAEGDILSVDPKLKLPVSISRENPKLRLIIQISSNDIMVDGVKVAEVKDALVSHDLLIKPVADALDMNTKRTEFIGSINPSIKFAGDVMIQGDRRIPFTLLKKVMYTCGQAGYGNISLAVMHSE